jgi:hypothetical protein
MGLEKRTWGDLEANWGAKVGCGGLAWGRLLSVTWRIQTCQPIKARDNIQQSPSR